MEQQQDPYLRVITRPQAGMLERFVFFALGLVVLVAAFFFIGIALIAGAILAGILLLRWWWLKRKLLRAQEETCVEGEYVVVEQLPEPPRKRPEKDIN